MKYNMKLNNEPFNLIKNGTKTVELRLNDEKRKLFNIGDEIEFTNITNGEKLFVDIINLHKYPSFEELYKHFDKVEMGYNKDEPAESKDMEAYYSKEEQDKYGVLGIEIRKKKIIILFEIEIYDKILMTEVNMIITSLTNSRIKEICKLKEKKYRNMTNTFLIEGINLVTEAGKRNLLKEIFVLEEKTINIDIPTTYVTKEVMKKISSTDSIPNVVGVSLKKEELLLGDRLLLLDNLQDPGNLGTIIRSSKAFNIDTIVISPTTVDMYNPKVLRATEGMIFHINIIVRDLPSLITELKKDNYKIYGTKVDGGINVKDISLKRKYALVIGNEGNGVSEEVNNLCDEYLYIKMNKEVESLNAGVATSILLYEMDDKYDIN